ncbi:HET-domain-containing protein [Colletotrichum falcatum]|nr:HET-domain-containing protein [Colletotrichum falcatum]
MEGSARHFDLRPHMASYEAITSVGDDIAEACQTNHEGHKFFPVDQWRLLVTKSNVSKVLFAADVAVDDTSLDFVMNRAAYWFVILVKMSTTREEKVSILRELQKEGFGNDLLPVKFVRRNCHSDHTEVWRWEPSLYDHMHPSQYSHPVLGYWERQGRDLFDKYQWEVMSPVFGTNQPFRFKFNRQVILPYLEVAGKAESNGFFGEVSRVGIHHAHIDVPELAGAKNLYELRDFGSKHLIKPIAAYEHGDDRCLLFPWADGGDLYQFWARHKKSPLAQVDLEWVTYQLTGLFSALEELSSSKWRHGDLKPENILLFVDHGNTTLQIADLGLSKFHNYATKIRKAANMPTDTPPGTSRYEPPEEDENRKKSQKKGSETYETRSRAYDIWSMGCVVLELFIWLTYGYTTVDEFRRKTSSFWKLDHEEYEIHPLAQSHMDAMLQKWPEGSICRDILRFAQTSLLVVKMPDDQNSPSGCRATATEAHKKMREIQRKHYRALRRAGSNTAQGDRGSGAGLAAHAYTRGSNKLNDQWHSFPDNTFASQVFNHISWSQIRPSLTGTSSSLCVNCSRTTTPIFFQSELQLSTMQRSCDLCGLLIDSLDRAGITSPAIVKLRQTGTTIGLEGGPNLLSIYIEPGPDVPAGRQIGLPRLPEPNSQEQLSLLKQWIQSCDSTHDACRRLDGQAASEMPTRLVKVTDPVRLLDSRTIGPSRYVALSHCWGRLQEHERFCLYKSNRSQLEAGVDFDRLPKTFRDAILVTRGLGLEYIWIDSLCIIQDDEDDWGKESAKMETVFSAAYCTLSAASAGSSLEGFLSARPPRPCVRLRTGGSRDLYVCPHIDDFHRDVELAEINQRGWVLQERALSRRSIYYSRTQVYWECGKGIRCETMGGLYNSKAAFLGDADFPRSALKFYRDGRQLLIQDLYERYSALAFTKASDRAAAILGLQGRLARAFGTRAAHGAFGSYFARSILWRRDEQLAEMTTIVQPAGRRRVPSWSWFSKGGRIRYMQLTFEKTEWMNGDFESPFDRPSSEDAPPKQTSSSACSDAISILRGLARRVQMDEEALASQVVFDMKISREEKDLRAVRIGRDKGEGDGPDGAKVHVLVIRKSSSGPGENMYERVGVASLSPAQVAAEGVWVDIH